MTTFNNPLWKIRHYLASSVDDLLYGVAGTTGATTTKTYAPFLWKANDYYNEHNFEVYVYAGTNIGVAKRVTDWVLADFLLTVHSAYSAACDATSWIELHHIFIEDEYRKAINLAIESIGDGKYLIDKIDATITLVADVYEYSIPAGFDFIHRIITENTANDGIFYAADEIDSRDWELIPGRKLKLHESHYGISAGKDLRIEGQGRQETVDDDNDAIYLPPDWLLQKAITFLPQNKIQSGALQDTYKAAVAISAREPTRYPHPESRRVID